MPPRDRKHELETESQRAFEAALTASFVVRALSDDYGIDREVEVFSEGQMTGLTFKVQLKGTDGSGKTCRVRRDSLDYWRSLDVPILLVSYEAKTGTLRGRWVHSIGHDGPDRSGNTITVRMDPDITIGEMSAQRFKEDLLIIRQLRRGEVPPEIPIRVRLHPAISGIERVQLESAIVVASHRSGRRIVVAQEDNAAIDLYVSQNFIRATTPLKWSSASFPTSTQLAWSIDPSELSKEFVILIAMALVPINPVAARDVILAADPGSPMWLLESITDALAPALTSPEAADLLFRIATHLEQINDLQIGVDDRPSVILPLLLSAGSVSQEVFDGYTTAARDAAHVGPGVNAARSALRHHNLGHLYKARKCYEAAAMLFRAAAALDTRYSSDATLHRHIGACEWELANFEESAMAYEVALELGFDAQELLPLLADSLMYSGQYHKALGTLSSWIPSGTKRDRIGLLHREMLEEIVNRLGMTTQQRQPYSGEKSEDWIKAGNVESLLRSTDALDPRLWIRLVSFEEDAESFRPALIAAMMVESEPVLWVNALICALSEEVSDEIIQGLLAQARFYCEGDFHDAVWAASGEQEVEGRELLRQLVSSTYVAPIAGVPITLRLLNTSSTGEWIVDQVEL